MMWAAKNIPKKGGVRGAATNLYMYMLAEPLKRANIYTNNINKGVVR